MVDSDSEDASEAEDADPFYSYSVPPPGRQVIFSKMKKFLDDYFVPRSDCPCRHLSALLQKLGPVGLPAGGIQFTQKEYDVGFAVMNINIGRGSSLIKSCLADDTDALFQNRDHFLRLLDTLAASRMFSLEISGALFRFDPKAKMLWEDKVEVVVVKGLEDVLR